MWSLRPTAVIPKKKREGKTSSPPAPFAIEGACLWAVPGTAAAGGAVAGGAVAPGVAIITLAWVLGLASFRALVTGIAVAPGVAIITLAWVLGLASWRALVTRIAVARLVARGAGVLWLALTSIARSLLLVGRVPGTLGLSWLFLRRPTGPGRIVGARALTWLLRWALGPVRPRIALVSGFVIRDRGLMLAQAVTEPLWVSLPGVGLLADLFHFAQHLL
jgi:hypothetical protein